MALEKSLFVLTPKHPGVYRSFIVHGRTLRPLIAKIAAYLSCTTNELQEHHDLVQEISQKPLEMVRCLL